jgi:lysophospholipase L1-like esterase
MIVPGTALAMRDVTRHWAKSVINEWSQYRWIGGYPDGTFRPDDPITRAEFVMLLGKSAPLFEEKEFKYTDVSIEQWYVRALRQAVAVQVVSGYPDGTFLPNKPISREEVAVAIGRVKKWDNQPDVTEQFKDAQSIALWSRGHIGVAVAQGLMKGYPDGTFGPTKPTTRAEAVTVLQRVFLGKEAPIGIVALGDSLTAGFGDETNVGYVQRLGKLLRERTNLPIYVQANEAVSGNKTTDVLSTLEAASPGSDLFASLQQAKHIVMTIGANDLYSLSEPLDLAVVSARMPQALENIKKIFAKIRALNPTAHVYYVGLYNPFGAGAGITQAIQSWNEAVTLLAPDKKTTIVSALNLFPAEISPYLAFDKYHLNGKGYALLAEKLADIAEMNFRPVLCGCMPPVPPKMQNTK